MPGKRKTPDSDVAVAGAPVLADRGRFQLVQVSHVVCEGSADE